MKIIAPIQQQPVIEKILTHLGLQARAPPQLPARRQAPPDHADHHSSSGPAPSAAVTGKATGGKKGV